MSTLDLVPVCLGEPAPLIERLQHELARALDVPVRVRWPWFDPELAFDARRGQYCATDLLRFLLADERPERGRVLGVAGVDLFVPVLTYVFGEAQLSGRAAVVSAYRLRPEIYGLPTNEELVFERLIKEALHELGHVSGLVHCTEPACVMHASTFVDEIDFKSQEFCPVCAPVILGA